MNPLLVRAVIVTSVALNLILFIMWDAWRQECRVLNKIALPIRVPTAGPTLSLPITEIQYHGCQYLISPVAGGWSVAHMGTCTNHNSLLSLEAK